MTPKTLQEEVLKDKMLSYDILIAKKYSICISFTQPISKEIRSFHNEVVWEYNK